MKVTLLSVHVVLEIKSVNDPPMYVCCMTETIREIDPPMYVCDENYKRE